MPTHEVGFNSSLVYPLRNRTTLARKELTSCSEQSTANSEVQENLCVLPSSAGMWAQIALITLPREAMQLLTGPGDRLLRFRHSTSYPLQLLICQLAFTVGMLVFFMFVDSLLMMMTGGWGGGELAKKVSLCSPRPRWQRNTNHQCQSFC